MPRNDDQILNRSNIPKGRDYKVAIICGDHKRFEIFKEHSTGYRDFGTYLCWKGAELFYDGEYILLASHGVGSHPTYVVVRELIELGVKCIIRSGTCGTYRPDIRSTGDICICYGAIRNDSSCLGDADLAYPAVAHPNVFEALRDASEALGIPTHLGMSYSSDLFYRRDITNDPRDTYAKYKEVVIEDTDNSAVLLLCNLYGVWGGALCTIDGCPLEWDKGNYQPHTEKMQHGKTNMVKLAMHAAANLSRQLKA
ncbi:phosphorylase family protein [Babesia bovis T2Bo]|uniref:Phosphorylase family protein n=1 Tax=Babesia bovis TaxID=5865 RepID=A7ANE3_BABBO|nr:phosphorylase family protein [Babesia bovis T2Bo]EDO08077.1 phosphorylase family protein [Babesia bovis T2Bo]BAN66214.1 phosphorylase family protein [Babesia bovis]|eukprot:XP_001611645.1 phosphorylase family protein [Babesia bovis T2Bo]